MLKKIFQTFSKQSHKAIQPKQVHIFEDHVLHINDHVHISTYEYNQMQQDFLRIQEENQNLKQENERLKQDKNSKIRCNLEQYIKYKQQLKEQQNTQCLTKQKEYVDTSDESDKHPGWQGYVDSSDSDAEKSYSK